MRVRLVGESASERELVFIANEFLKRTFSMYEPTNCIKLFSFLFDKFFFFFLN